MPIKKKFKFGMKHLWANALYAAIAVVGLTILFSLIIASIEALNDHRLNWSSYGQIVMWSFFPALEFALPLGCLFLYAVLGQSIRLSGHLKSSSLSGLSQWVAYRHVIWPIAAYLPLMWALSNVVTPKSNRTVKTALPNAITNLNFHHVVLDGVLISRKQNDMGKTQISAVQNELSYVFSGVSQKTTHLLTYESGTIYPLSQLWSATLGPGNVEWSVPSLKVEINERSSIDLRRSIKRWRLRGDDTSKPVQELLKRWINPLGTAGLSLIAFGLALSGTRAQFSAPLLFLLWWGMVRLSDALSFLPLLAAGLPTLIVVIALSRLKWVRP